ncbi:hypothetical protein MSAN_00301400 [Mycena sanguinolenta]|uniref:F-box domain-containing protein n=1 Tax=Mycena sanguinolenta TaxID=230812 RepID=A0A8H6ZEJ9_9AGAR|nr:hypothetical protein MSAN_00301400 [Mycena sanguinolenta]
MGLYSCHIELAHTVEVPRGPLRIVAPDSVHTLHLDAPDETASLLTAFQRAQLPHLVILSLQHLFDLDMFLAFMAQCPALEVLKIISVDPDVIVSLPQCTLSLDTIPDLRDLTIRGEMLGLFSSKRPIAAVTILNEPLDRQRHPAPDFTPIVLNDLSKASVPLISLSIPETSPTLELLTSITLLFPQLKQFSIHLKQPERPHIYETPLRRRLSVNKQCPILHDAEAFDDIPEDELSDAEQEKSPPIALVRVPKELQMSSSTNLQKILHWTCSGAASLPQEIEVLRFICDDDFPPPSSVLTKEDEVVATLSHIYPHLRELQMGYLHALWTREGVVWRKGSSDSYVQVVL